VSADHPAPKPPPALFAALFGDGSLEDAVASLTAVDSLPPVPAPVVQNDPTPLPSNDPAEPALAGTAFAPADSRHKALRETPSAYQDQATDYAADTDLGTPSDTGSADLYTAASEDASWFLEPMESHR
jgi:hypothetical protein